MNISPNVKIMTAEEYAASGDAAFQRGVKRGKFEALSELSKPVEVTMRCNFEFVETPKPPNQGTSVVRQDTAPPRIELHCWSPQRRAIEATFRRPFDMRLRTVHSLHQMQGITNGIFVEVVGHPYQIPNQMRQNIGIYGWTLVTIDDSAARARAGR